MTNPTLAALLNDPDFDARLIAADRLDDANRPVEAGLMRLLAGGGPVIGDSGGWHVEMCGIIGCVGASILAYREQGPAWEYLLFVGRQEEEIASEWFQRAHMGAGLVPCQERGVSTVRGDEWDVIRPGLEAAVLAVLRGQLEEMRR